ncbi:hypothetical protein [Vulcanisaeta sp. JCM 16159]|nr:hypothetical protein [Vulcanisaeta sp. JCM 16159]
MGPTIFGYFNYITRSFISDYLIALILYVIALTFLYSVKYIAEKGK